MCSLYACSLHSENIFLNNIFEMSQRYLKGHALLTKHLNNRRINANLIPLAVCLILWLLMKAGLTILFTRVVTVCLCYKNVRRPCTGKWLTKCQESYARFFFNTHGIVQIPFSRGLPDRDVVSRNIDIHYILTCKHSFPIK